MRRRRRSRSISLLRLVPLTALSLSVLAQYGSFLGSNFAADNELDDDFSLDDYSKQPDASMFEGDEKVKKKRKWPWTKKVNLEEDEDETEIEEMADVIKAGKATAVCKEMNCKTELSMGDWHLCGKCGLLAKASVRKALRRDGSDYRVLLTIGNEYFSIMDDMMTLSSHAGFAVGGQRGDGARSGTEARKHEELYNKILGECSWNRKLSSSRLRDSPEDTIALEALVLVPISMKTDASQISVQIGPDFYQKDNKRRLIKPPGALQITDLERYKKTFGNSYVHSSLMYAVTSLRYEKSRADVIRAMRLNAGLEVLLPTATLTEAAAHATPLKVLQVTANKALTQSVTSAVLLRFACDRGTAPTDITQAPIYSKLLLDLNAALQKMMRESARQPGRSRNLMTVEQQQRHIINSFRSLLLQTHDRTLDILSGNVLDVSVQKYTKETDYQLRNANCRNALDVYGTRFVNYYLDFVAKRFAASPHSIKLF